MNEQFDDAIVRVANLLKNHNLAFALIGGLASSIRGRLRVTGDIDIVVDCEVSAAVLLLKQMDEKSFQPFVEDAEISIRQFYVLPIVDVESGTPIDLAIGASGFEKMIVERASTPAGYSIPVATAEDLLLMKMMAGRSQDIGDVNGIVEICQDTIDWNYCIEIAGQLQETLDFDLVEAIRNLKNA